MTLRILSLLIVLISGSFFAAGTTSVPEYVIRFRVNSSTVDSSYSNNAAAVNGLVSAIDSINSDSKLHLDKVTFTGSTSPDGPFSFNKKLTDRRLNSAMRYICSRAGLASTPIEAKYITTDWNLLKAMISDSEMPWKDEALKAIDSLPETESTANGRLTTPRKNRLMTIDGGRAWRYMLHNFFPALRNTCIVTVTTSPKEEAEAQKAETKPAKVANIATIAKVADLAQEPEEAKPAKVANLEDKPAEVADTAQVTEVTEVAEVAEAIEVAVAVEKERKPFYMSLSTNMLYDALLVPNVAAEFYLGKDWSIAADWMYGWWDTDRRHRYWRIYGGELALRKWFGAAAKNKPLTGHHAGVYVQAITYDFEFGGKGQMGGKPGGSLWDKCSYGVGLEYGYSMPVAPRLNIDFTIGVGYFGGTYYEYRPIDGHYIWQATKNRRWFGPTRAMVSLVWLLGHGNRNEKKGGGK